MLASCGPGQRSHASEKLGHGVFTYLLAEGLAGKADQDKDNSINLNELYDYVREKTRLYVEVVLGEKQEPSLIGKDQGDVVLTKAEAPRTLIVPDQYATIGAAIEAAREGDTIQVKPGVYRESIILKAGLHLLGTDRSACRLEVPDDAEALIKAADCTSGRIANLTLDGRGISSGDEVPDGIALSDSKIEVQNCIIEKFVGAGIWVKGSGSAPTIQDNVCRKNKNQGVIFTDGAGGTATGNTCESNGESGIGVYESGTAPSLKKNTCLKNEKYGVYFEQGAKGIAENNTCEQNTWSGVGVFDKGTEPTLKDNVCLKNKLDGIYFGDGAIGIATSNTCEANQRSGIAVTGAGTAPTLKENTCAQNTNHGIYFGKGARGTAEGNVCEKNESGGISVFDAGSSPRLTGNTCRNNSEHGIYFGNGAEGVAEGNTCNRNKWDGIAAADPGTEPVLRGNRCNNNGSWGINYFEDATPLIAPDSRAARNKAGQIKPSP